MSGSRVQHGHAQHGGPEHGLAQHGDTKVLQVRAREHLMWFCGSCAVMLCNRRADAIETDWREGWTACIQPDAGAGSIGLG